MRESAFRFLTDKDWRRLLQKANHAVYHKNDEILEEGSHRQAIFIIRRGTVRVERAHLLGQDVAIARIGPGDIFGEMSFLEDTGASSSIVADDDIEVDVIDGYHIHSLLSSDAGFSARFYQSLAVNLSRRLRQTSAMLAPLIARGLLDNDRLYPDQDATTQETGSPAEVVRAIEDFKLEMLQVDHDLRDHYSEEVAAQERVEAICQSLVDSLAQAMINHPNKGKSIGPFVSLQTRELFNSSAFVRHCFTKPKGYLGDYESLDMIHNGKVTGKGRLGPIISRWVMDINPIYAFRNRRALLREMIMAVTARYGPEPVTLTSLGSGPAFELFDLVDEAPLTTFHATCVDMDPDNLAHISRMTKENGLAGHIITAEDNPVRLVRGHGKTLLTAQHLIYSPGLLEQLQDDYVVSVLNWAHNLLVPGGTILLFNLNLDQRYRSFMDHVLDWPQIHRSPEQIQALVSESEFGDDNLNITIHSRGLDLMIRATKPAEPSE